MKTKTAPATDSEKFTIFPNFHKSGSIKGMKNLYYGKDALLIKCGSYIYKVTPEIYKQY